MTVLRQKAFIPFMLLALAASTAYAQVQANNFSERATALARQVDDVRPDLIPTLGDARSDRTRSGLWPPDHARVAAGIRLR